jgi:hypothetical protein
MAGGPVVGPTLVGWLVRHVQGDADRLIASVRDAVRRRQWQRFWLGPAAAIAIASLAATARTRPGYGWVQHVAIVRAEQPWHLWLARLPLSVFAPAALLPFWAAMLEVLVTFAIAQVLLGWRRTLIVAFWGHAMATVSTRFWVWLGTPVGVAPHYLQMPDAGPSAAVLALVAYIAVEFRLIWLAIAWVLYEAIETVTINGLTQREHLVGVVAGAVAALVWRASRGTRPTSRA